tara:strand:+ start:453 stop:710 length:258 start_codon:yes stop_codon:yes gene_type:complete
MAGKKRVIVAINELGYRIGSSHHNAKITDDVVDQIRDLHEEEGMSYRKLAALFLLPRGTIVKICLYERRAQTPLRWKTLHDREKD